MIATVGFLVWNPSRSLPTVVHDTLERALAEAERLKRLNPSERFVIMSPIMAGSDASAAKAWSDGKAEGIAEARREVMRAEKFSDQWCETAKGLERTMRRLGPIREHQRRYQAIVADCLLWFDGFAAAFGAREGWEQPRIPDRDTIRDLNRALLDLEEAPSTNEQEIPF